MGKEVKNMTNVIYQGKINRQSTQSTTKKFESTRLQLVIWGGPFRYNLSNEITFFHYVKRIE